MMAQITGGGDGCCAGGDVPTGWPSKPGVVADTWKILLESGFSPAKYICSNAH